MVSNLKIIIADDHPIFRDGLNTVLRRQEFIEKITQAANGTEAIQLLESEHYDVVLMDIKMEPMNGLEATEIIRHRFPNVKIIALSMFGEERYIMEMIDKGASGYLLKNSKKSEIIAAIKAVVKGGTYFSDEVNNFILERLSAIKKGEKITPDYMENRMREVLFLMCHEKTSKEIANALNISVRTIDDCRADILKITNSKNIVGVVKYAIQSGIMEDEILRSKFSDLIG